MRIEGFLLPIISALAVTLSIFYCFPILGAVSLVPLLFSLQHADQKRFIYQVICFVAIYTSFLFAWMLGSSTQFTGNISYGILGMLFSITLFTFLITCVFWLWRKLCKPPLSWRSIFVLSGLFVLFEYFCSYIFKNLPWYSFHFGNSLIGSEYTIQLAEFGGIYVLTFFIFLINGALTYALKNQSQIKFAVTTIIAFLITNIFLFNYRTVTSNVKTDITINLLNANVLPTTNWETVGNALVPQIIALSEQSIGLPEVDFNVWTESVVPWTYRADDDFIAAVLSNTSNHSTINLIGMNTDFNQNSVFNSAYAIHPNGAILGRYDKVYPLAFMEAPLAAAPNLLFANYGYQVRAGHSLSPISTPKGKVGVFICNEATIPTAVAEQVKNGAEFLVNISNDGWFKDTYIVRQHFYYNRLRAVENRRDIAVNSNCGYSGKAAANGEILMIKQSDLPTINQISLTKADLLTTNTLYPNAFILLITLLTIFIISFKTKKT